MATYTGALSGSPYIYVDTTITQKNQEVLNNRTLVNVLVQLRSTSTSSYDNYGTGSLTVYMDGATIGSASGSTLNFNFSSYTVKDLLSFDVWVPHDSTGDKTANFRTVISYPSGKPHGNSDVNANVTFTTIPRGSVLGTIPNFVVDGNEGVGVPISVPQTTYSSSFFNALSVYVGETFIGEFLDYKNQEIVFDPTHLQRIYDAIQTTNSAMFTFNLATYAENGGEQIGATSTKQATGTISEIGRAPTIPVNAAVYFDSNPVSVAVTGDSQTIVEGVSKIAVRLNEKAVPNKRAAMRADEAYRIWIGEYAQAASHSDTFPVTKTFHETVSIVPNARLEVTDSRGNSSELLLPWANYIEYEKPVITDIRLRRQHDMEAPTEMYVAGKIWAGNFGVANNAVENVSYRYRETNSETWVVGETELTNKVTVDAGTGNFEIAFDYINGDLGAGGFSDGKSFIIEVLVTDKVAVFAAETTLNVGTPAFVIKKFYNPQDIFRGYGFGVGVRPPDIGVYQNDGLLLAKDLDVRLLANLTGNNVIKNGDFKDTSYWLFFDANVSVSGNVLSFTATQSLGTVVQDIQNSTTLQNHKMLAIVTVKSNAGEVIVQFADNVSSGTRKVYNGSGEWETFFIPITVGGAATNVSLSIYDQKSSGWVQIDVKEAMVFDLTAAFGAGMEPTNYEQIKNHAVDYFEHYTNGSAFITETNANGQAMKFSDGTMFCVGKKTNPNIAFSPTGSVYYAGFGWITFPATFVAPPIVIISIQFGNIGTAQLGTVQNGQFYASIMSAERLRVV